MKVIVGDDGGDIDGTGGGGGDEFISSDIWLPVLVECCSVDRPISASCPLSVGCFPCFVCIQISCPDSWKKVSCLLNVALG